MQLFVGDFGATAAVGEIRRFGRYPLVLPPQLLSLPQARYACPRRVPPPKSPYRGVHCPKDAIKGISVLVQPHALGSPAHRLKQHHLV